MNENISVLPHPYPCQRFMLSVFWIVAILISVLWYLDAIVDFGICSALMTYDVAHLHVWWFAIFTTSWVKYLSKCLIHFLIGLFVFILTILESFAYFGKIYDSPLSDVYPVYSLSSYFLGSVFHKENLNLLKWIKDLNVRPETIKLLEENIGKTLSNIHHSRILYDPPPRILEIKAKINKLFSMAIVSWSVGFTISE